MEEQEVRFRLVECLKLLRDLADLQNDAPLERHRKEWEKTMEDVRLFLSENERLINVPHPTEKVAG